MSKYGWIITDDLLNDPKGTTEVGVCGPRHLSPEMEARLKAGEGKRFGMRDGDGTVYYRGLYIGDGSGFEPLDDFGDPNSGCTSIEYEVKPGTWEGL